MSDVSGRIAHVFFALPSYDPSFVNPILSSFRGIREALGPSVRCTVLHRPAQAALVDETLGARGPLDAIFWEEGFVLRLGDTSATVDGGTLRVTRLALPDFTNWVQDAFLVAANAAGVAELWASPHVRRRYGGWDDAVPKRLADHLGWTCQTLPCAIEAGNVLVDHQAVVVGGDVRAAAAPAEWDAFRDKLAAHSRDVIICGAEAPQPLFHVDLYVALAGPHHTTGRPLALVSSARLARAILGQASTDSQLDDGLDAVALELTTRGYTVERLPLLPFTGELAPAGAWYSYANCLVELFDDTRRVVLPAYGRGDSDPLDTLDAAARDTWSALGFDVRLARGEFAYLAQLGGSVRCRTKVLRRDSQLANNQ
jgi:hypothetical protein